MDNLYDVFSASISTSSTQTTPGLPPTAPGPSVTGPAPTTVSTPVITTRGAAAGSIPSQMTFRTTVPGQTSILSTIPTATGIIFPGTTISSSGLSVTETVLLYIDGHRFSTKGLTQMLSLSFIYMFPINFKYIVF